MTKESTFSLREDLSAVRVRLVENRSIGPIGCLFNKRKLLKRWGYDQTKFDQLKARTPAA